MCYFVSFSFLVFPRVCCVVFVDFKRKNNLITFWVLCVCVVTDSKLSWKKKYYELSFIELFFSLSVLHTKVYFSGFVLVFFLWQRGVDGRTVSKKSVQKGIRKNRQKTMGYFFPGIFPAGSFWADFWKKKVFLEVYVIFLYFFILHTVRNWKGKKEKKKKFPGIFFPRPFWGYAKKNKTNEG